MRPLIYTRGEYIPRPFIMSVKTDNAGTSNNDQFNLLLSASLFNVTTSDGQIFTDQNSSFTITFPAPGTYDIMITGLVYGFAYSNADDIQKITEIKQWGDIRWNFDNSAKGFGGAVNLILTNVTDTPKLGNSTDLSGFFYNCISITTINNIENWKIPPTVISMGGASITGGMFGGCVLFDGDLSNWDFFNVPTLSNTFAGCANFNNGGNPNINNWDTSSIVLLNNTFSGCSSFNQPIGNWNVSNVLNCENMFLNATSFNQSLNNWNVSKITSFQDMFRGATSFNQPLNNWIFNLISTVRCDNMFNGAIAFNQPLNNWNASRVTSFSNTFNGAVAFNQSLSNWRPSLAGFTNFMAGKSDANYSAANLDGIYNNWTEGALLTARTANFGTIKRTAASTEARALLTRTNTTRVINSAVNNGSGLIRVTTTVAHGLTSGNKIFISGVLGTIEANKAWNVTVIDATTVDLIGSVFTNAYISGGTLRTGWGWSVTDGGI
jgi:surface protein